MIHILGAPFDGGGARLGSRLGPAALELAGLKEALDGQGLTVGRWTNLAVPPECQKPGLRNMDGLVETVRCLRTCVLDTIAEGDMPIVLGGEHSVAIGGVSAALEATKGDLAVLWIDAHADINTPGRSDSGNLHGMPIAALAGLPSETSGEAHTQWEALVTSMTPQFKLSLNRMAWFGLRDVDRGEREIIAAHPESLAITMYDVDYHGVVAQLVKFDEWMRKGEAANLWISFDVDALDPILAPGTGTAVRGGLTYREAHLLAEVLRQKLDAPDSPYRLIGLDVVETNPLADADNSTAKMAVEWIASLFGKSILGGARP